MKYDPTRINGTLVRWTKFDYGFIERDYRHGDVFVGTNQLGRSGIGEIKVGTRVSFCVCRRDNKRNDEAMDVHFLDNGPNSARVR